MTTVISGTSGITTTRVDSTAGVGGIPAFSAKRTSNQAAGASGVFTKIQFNVKEFDTTNAFDSVTNYRFQPTVAGYYQMSASCYVSGGISQNYVIVNLHKNGVAFKGGATSGSAADFISTVNTLVFLNGSTDYLEDFAVVTYAGGSPVMIGTQDNCFFQGYLARAA